MIGRCWRFHRTDLPIRAAARLADAPPAARVNAIALGPVEDFRRDSDLFGKEVRTPEAQSRIQAAITRGLQMREGEMALAQMLRDLDER